jgi:DNA-binding MarR family transcriptional regulator
MATEREEVRSAVRGLAMAARHLERAAAPLSLPQYRILALTAAAPERASRLAARADVTKATLTGVIDSLVQHGWVSRADVEGDRRGVALSLTPAGAAVLAEAEAAMCAWLRALAPPAAIAGLAGLHAAIQQERARA